MSDYECVDIERTEDAQWSSYTSNGGRGMGIWGRAERTRQGSKTGNGLETQNAERAHGGLLEVKITKGAADSEAGVGAARSADDAPAALHFHAPAALLHSCFLPLQPRLVVCRVALSWSAFPTA